MHRLRFAKGRVTHMGMPSIDWPSADWDGNPTEGDLSIREWLNYPVCGAGWSDPVPTDQPVTCKACLREGRRLVAELKAIELNVVVSRTAIQQVVSGLP